MSATTPLIVPVSSINPMSSPPPLLEAAKGQLQQQPRTQVIQTSGGNTTKYKTNLCRHYKNGNCQLGSICHFAHGEVDVRTVSDPLPSNIPQQTKVMCNNFKTVKCRYYERGFCKNQHACCFAHGDGDVTNNLYSGGGVGSSNGANSNGVSYPLDGATSLIASSGSS